MVARDASGGALERCCIAARLFACAGASLPRGGPLRAGLCGYRKFCARRLLSLGVGRPGAAPFALGLPRPLDRILDDPPRLTELVRLVRPGGEAARRADLVGEDFCPQVAEHAEQAGQGFEQPALFVQAQDQLGETAQVGHELLGLYVVVESHDGSGWSRREGPTGPI